MSIVDQYTPPGLDPADRALYRSIFNSVFADTRSTVKAMTAATGMLSRSYLGMAVKSTMSGDFLAGWCIKFSSHAMKDRADPPTFFTRKTNFYLEQYPVVPSLWFHTGEVLGERASYSIHNYGIWASVRLAETRRKQRLVSDARAGKLGFSTGTMNHILNGPGGFDPRTGEVLSWPWTELSICPFREIAEPGLGCLVIDTESIPAKADRVLENSIKRYISRL